MVKPFVKLVYDKKLTGCLVMLVLNVVWMAGCNGPATTASQQMAQGSGGKSPFMLTTVPLVSNVPDVATHRDSKMADAWGLEFGHTDRIWVNNSTGYSTVYDGNGNGVMIDDENGQKVPLAVKVPVPNDSNGDANTPLTGMVFSAKSEFLGDSFVFASEQGTITGWSEPMKLKAAMRVDNSGHGAVYKGLTAADAPQGPRLYATNFAQRTIDVFDGKYQPVTLAGKFADPSLPANYAPFGIKAINGAIYVTYAEQSIDKGNDIGAVGHGYIDVFTTEGVFQKRLVSNGPLNSPWGMALAPSDFGAFSKKLLVGNFRDGYIHVFDPTNGQLLGQVIDKDGQPLQIDMLWALTFGTDNGAGKHNQLFFTAGSSSEQDGLFGRLDLVQ